MKFKTRLAIDIASKKGIKLGEMETNLGKLHFVENELTEGADVWMDGANGESVMPADGDYTVDGMVYSVANGVVVKIGSVAPAGSDPAAPPAANPPVNTALAAIVSVEDFEAVRADMKALRLALEDMQNGMSTKLAAVSVELEEVSTKLGDALKDSAGKFVPPVDTVDPPQSDPVKDDIRSRFK